MKKTFCDICEKEIGRKEDWCFGLHPPIEYKSLDISMDDICEECAITIYQCVMMMKECSWKPDFHEALNSESVWTRDIAGHVLHEIEEEIDKAKEMEFLFKNND